MSLNDFKYDMKKDRMGQGGNGSVYKATDSEQREVAIKVCHFKKTLEPKTPQEKFNNTRLRRFEIEADKGHELSQKGQRGIIPIMHLELPCKDTGKSFFVMPIATPMEQKIEDIHNIYDLTSIMKELAAVLVEFHDQDITHRDIKPDNILFYNGSYCLSDLGLIDFPEKEDLTRVGETLGNRKTMAPEMRTPKEAKDHKPADVYSFAKTLWMVLTKEEFAFDGQFNPFENMKLQQKYPNQHFVELYELLRHATYEDPSKRPSMVEFMDRLDTWEDIAQDSMRAAESAWRFIEHAVIQQQAPSTVMWRKVEQVVDILNRISVLNFNHTFYPNGGGNDLVGAELATWHHDPNMISLNFGDGFTHLLRVKRLVWEQPNYDLRFSYFRLEVDPLTPIYPQAVKDYEAYKASHNVERVKEYSEQLILDSAGAFHPFHDDDTAHYVVRWFDGALLFVQKGSVYNMRIHAAYDGRHTDFTADGFREYMELLQSVYANPVLMGLFKVFAENDPLKNNHLETIKKWVQMSPAEVLQNLPTLLSK